MARGGLSYAGIGFQAATFKAGAGIKALVADGNRDSAVDVAVVISSAGEVDLGTDGDTIFGFIDVYEDDGHCTVQIRGFREGVKVSEEATHTATINKVAAVNGKGAIKDSATTAKLRTPLITEVDATSKTATVFLG